MLRRLVFLVLVLVGAAAAFLAFSWWGGGPTEEETGVIVAEGTSVAALGEQLAEDGQIDLSPGLWRLNARLFGGGDPIRAGEFTIPPGTSAAGILDIVQHARPVQRFITIPEGMPSVLVRERVQATDLLVGEAPLPAEGTVLPQTYSFQRGDSRAAVIARMQEAMSQTLEELWPTRTERSVVETPAEAVILASIVEKETAKPSERRMVAGVYSNRLRIGMKLDADPTVIYPITKGKPLGRRIRRSELNDVNDYNTYAMAGLPAGPIANPGRESIAAVLDPAETDALYFVADGTGGHVFASTLEEHNRNVAKWYEIRRRRGEM
ncbi:endolytic transglycosylase MltG [Sphingomicrobium astaxanthinifaciens]|uniref:endolytic transglycosylase MltG n=1 Tax=Sphingomicrobium astaxanthinifaciens TaxID=1227949 RepID=UPI001FCC45F3|nr:endolytic transglycosylase MltG [Sphingomicrobium astaxanthinifaciens]MCJ7422019.1 endolytic transglycosylase MltG [Sphingomicrobium astaxanthinifaciens]